MTKYMPPHDKEGYLKRYMTSNRYNCDKYDYPNTEWEFYNTFHNCSITETAIKNQQLSTDFAYIDDYMKDFLKKEKKFNEVIVETLPEPFEELLALRNEDEHWTNLEAVKRVLSLGEDTPHIPECQVPRQEATSFALAAIR